MGYKNTALFCKFGSCCMLSIIIWYKHTKIN